MLASVSSRNSELNNPPCCVNDFEKVWHCRPILSENQAIALPVIMRRWMPLMLSALSISLLPSQPVNASEVCRDEQSTVAESRCVMEALQAVDRKLETALVRVVAEVASIGDETFRSLWRENLTGFYRTSADPKQQATAFRAERRQVCAFAKSVSFQGTGYGIFTTRCELALTKTLLDQLQP